MLLTYLQTDDAIMATNDIADVKIPESAMENQLTQLIRDTENDLLGTVNGDVLAFKESSFQCMNFCRIISNSRRPH
jgi:hypothetical protein